MRSQKFWISAVIGLFVVLLALVIARELDVKRQEQRITELATALTGRKVETRGGIRIGFSLRPTLVATDVRVANAAWGSQPTMLAVDRIDVSLALLPLLFGSIDLVSVRLSGVELLLETDSAGRRNWDLGVDGSDAVTSDFDVPAKSLVVENLALDIRTPNSEEATPIEVMRIALAAEDATRPLSLELSARRAGVEFSAVGSVGPVEDWLSGKQIPLSLDLRWGLSEFTADATLDLGDPPRLQGQIHSGTLDLEEWLTERPARSEGTADRDRLFPTTPLGLADLGSSNADISLTVAHVTDEKARLELTHADASLEAGILRVDSAKGILSDAEVDASLEIDGRAALPLVRLSFIARDLDLGELLDRLELTDEVDAAVDVRVNVHGSGDSVAAILGSLTGNVSLGVSRGEIPTGYVDRLVSDLSVLVMPWATPAKRVEVRCAIAEFVIAGGVARIQTLMFDTARLTLRGKGEIDLGKETLDLVLAPRPRNHKLVTLATDITLTGPLSEPHAYPSPIGLVSSAARLALEPVLLLSPLPADDAEHQRECVDRVRNVGGSAPDHRRSGPSRDDVATEVVEHR